MRSARRTGLLRTLLAPAARKRSRSLDIECALAITIGIAGISALIRRIASRPSMPGMATSMRIIAGRWWSAMSTACSPSPAIKTGYPAFSSTRLQSRCATSLSSATRTEGGRVVPAASVSGMPELQCVRAFGCERDREVEGRAVTDGAFHPDLAPVHLHDLLNDREAEASPGDGLRGAAADPTEAFEDVPDLVLGDADAGVGDADQDVASVGSAGQGDGPALGRILHRIVDDVADNLDQPVAVAGHDRQARVEVGLELHRDRARRRPRDRLHEHIVDIDLGGPHGHPA